MWPHRPEVKFIVQDKESALFLMPCEGDVGFTPWAHEAGRFDGFAEAVDTAAVNCNEGYFVTQIVPMLVSTGLVRPDRFWEER